MTKSLILLAAGLMNAHDSLAQVYWPNIPLDEKERTSEIMASSDSFSVYTIEIDSTFQLYFSFFEKAVRSEGFLENNRATGIWYYYHSNGKVEGIINYVDDCESGFVTTFFDNGNLESFGQSFCIDADTVITSQEETIDPETGETITSFISQTSLSVNDGTWYYFDKTGKFLRKEYWNMGEIERTE